MESGRGCMPIRYIYKHYTIYIYIMRYANAVFVFWPCFVQRPNIGIICFTFAL